MLAIFVDIPITKCVCIDSAGQNLQSYVVSVCARTAPLSFLPTLFMVANQASGATRLTRSSLACSTMVGVLKKHINSSMDTWFDGQYKSLDAMGGAIDYLTAAWDSNAGKCADFEHDPHVVVIVPWPSDHFQRCAMTSSCKAICRLEWAQFEAARSRSPGVVQLPELTVTSESLFFPGQEDRALSMSNVTSSVEISPVSFCLNRESTVPPDYAIALAQCDGLTVSVQFWCVPRQASATVYRVAGEGDWYFGEKVLSGDLLASRFNEGAEWLALLIMELGETKVHWLKRAGFIISAPDLSINMPYGATFVRIQDMWVIEGSIVVDVVVRRFESNRAMGGVVNMHIRPGIGDTSTWRATMVSLVQFNSGGGKGCVTKGLGFFLLF